MPRTCLVCASKYRKEIERKIMSNVPHTQIAKGYRGITNQSIRYHTKYHLSKQLLKLQEKGELEHFKSMSEEIEDLIKRTKSILNDAESKKKHKLSLRAIDSLRSTYQFVCQIGAYLNEQQQRNEAQEKKKQIDDLENLSDRESDLLEALLLKIESGGQGEEITGVCKMGIYRQMKCERDNKEKVKRRRKVKWDFEDEKEEEDLSEDGGEQDNNVEESKEEGEGKKGKAKNEVVESVEDTDSIKGRDMCPDLSGTGKTLDGRSISDL